MHLEGHEPLAILATLKPKTRASYGRSQYVLLWEVGVVKWLKWLCQDLAPDQKLWPGTAATFRSLLHMALSTLAWALCARGLEGCAQSAPHTSCCSRSLSPAFNILGGGRTRLHFISICKSVSHALSSRGNVIFILPHPLGSPQALAFSSAVGPMCLPMPQAAPMSKASKVNLLWLLLPSLIKLMARWRVSHASQLTLKT